MRAFVIAGSRSRGEPVTPPATRAWATASAPSSAMKGELFLHCRTELKGTEVDVQFDHSLEGVIYCLESSFDKAVT